ncbi:acyltransferase [Streptomyces sp. VRA16 Mangrove soil]|uniref:acyltransferase family protein n=1 Tax=Streptomyces sp. VRA16 Mangrove soil TaxID=2817434 RepID=UPI001A9FCEF0|nr:acyltransferase [Streptomyces sp. VRA16 Mangrove soil]MBO1333068.1 acyltransferase [Streptomyces sp. VRA16 Mangrove soil]
MTLASLRKSASAAVASIDAKTPAHRDRAVDGLRALALLAVPTGHWLLGGFTVDAQGALHNASPLSAFSFFAPLSWVLQMLGIFFLVGGYASALSYSRARERGTSTSEWLRGRLARLGRPVLGVTAVWATLLPALHALGVPWQTLRTGSTLVIQPLWFVGVYAAITALTPWCLRAARRWGAWAAAPLIGSVALVDFLRYGPFAPSMPSWLSLLNLLPGWLFAYQLGVSWGEKKLGRRGAWALLIGGAVLFAALLLVFHYPTSMVGVPGEARTNSHPPSLLVLALAAAQSGAAILLHNRIGALLRRPALWAPVVIMNLSAMTILCWHQTAMLTAAIPASFAGAVPGLTQAPDTLAWVATRLAWLPLFAVLLALTGRYARGFEAPWTRARRGRRALAGVLAAGFAVFALGLA